MEKPHITITLGRTGQVVKKRGSTPGNADSDWRGNKRSMRERLGGDSDSFLFSGSKRHRGDSMKWNPGNNGVDDSRIARNDLRLKLMRKGLSKKVHTVVEERKEMDLREKLPKTIQHPVSAKIRQQRPELVGSSFPRQNTPKESADDLDSLRKAYTSRTLDMSRARSPDRSLNMSRISPQIKFNELRQISSMRGAENSRASDVSRAGLFLSNDVDASRPRGPAPITIQGTLATTKPVIRLARTPITVQGNLATTKPVIRLSPTDGSMQKSSYMEEEPLTVTSLLHSIGLGKYAILFQAEEVDMTALKQMGDKDLKELGIPMFLNKFEGPRKKILLAILPRSKRKPAYM